MCKSFTVELHRWRAGSYCENRYGQSSVFTGCVVFRLQELSHFCGHTQWQMLLAHFISNSNYFCVRFFSWLVLNICSVHEPRTKQTIAHFIWYVICSSETLWLEKKFGNRIRKPMLFIHWFISFQLKKKLLKNCSYSLVWLRWILAVYWLLQPTPVFDRSLLNKYQNISFDCSFG